MGINDIALGRVLKFLVEEKAIVKLVKVMENEKTSSSSEPVLRSSKKKMLMWSHTTIEHTMPWLN